MYKIKLLSFMIASGLILSSLISCSDDGGGGNGYFTPDTPAEISATRGDYKDRIEIDWTPVPDTDKYIVFKSIDNKDQFRVIADNVKEIPFNDTDITPNRKYYYKVSAAIGEQWSEKSKDALGFAHTGKPIAPEIVHISKDIIGEIQLTWGATPQTDSYKILRSDRINGTYEKITGEDITIPEGAEEYTYTDSSTELVRDKSYYYKVISVNNEEGESNQADPVYGIALENIPSIQAEFLIEASNNENAFGNKIVVTWDNILLAKTYSVYRCETADGEYVEISRGVVPDTTGKCFYEDTTAFPGTPYFYKITGVSSGGESEKSNCAEGYADPTKPDQATAPINVLATSGEFTSITVSWDPVEGADKYKIYRSTEINGTYTGIGTTEEPEFSFTDSDLLLTSDLNKFVNFFYYVTASNGSESRASVPVQGYAKPLIPLVPGNTSATKNRDDAKIMLSFSLSERASRFNIYRSESIDGTYNRIVSAPKTGDTINYEENHPAIEVGKRYFYKFSSSNVSGESERSDPIEGNTILKRPGKPSAEKPGRNQRTVSWAPVPHATQYIVEHKAKDSGSWIEYTVTTTERLFSDLAGWSTNHYWRVRAKNENTESVTSEELKITIHGID